MSKVTISYNLSKDSDEYEYEAVRQAGKLRSAIQEMSAYLREQYKYAATPDDITAIRERFHQILTETGVDLADI